MQSFTEAQIKTIAYPLVFWSQLSIRINSVVQSPLLYSIELPISPWIKLPATTHTVTFSGVCLKLSFSPCKWAEIDMSLQLFCLLFFLFYFIFICASYTLCLKNDGSICLFKKSLLSFSCCLPISFTDINVIWFSCLISCSYLG